MNLCRPLLHSTVAKSTVLSKTAYNKRFASPKKLLVMNKEQQFGFPQNGAHLLLSKVARVSTYWSLAVIPSGIMSERRIPCTGGLANTGPREDHGRI